MGQTSPPGPLSNIWRGGGGPGTGGEAWPWIAAYAAMTRGWARFIARLQKSLPLSGVRVGARFRANTGRCLAITLKREIGAVDYPQALGLVFADPVGLRYHLVGDLVGNVDNPVLVAVE